MVSLYILVIVLVVICRAHSFARAAEFRAEPRNFRVSAEFHRIPLNMEILRQRPNSVSLYCCCNCDTQSLWTATRACWFQWRVFTYCWPTYL